MSGDAAPLLLVSMPQMADPNFSQTVVLLCDYTDQGAFGLIVNRPMSVPWAVRTTRLRISTWPIWIGVRMWRSAIETTSGEGSAEG